MSKFIRIDCKITSEERRCKFVIERDLAALDAFKTAIAGKMDIVIEAKNDDDEEEPEVASDDEEIKMKLDEILLSYTSTGDNKPIDIKSNDEFAELMEFYLNNNEEFKIGRVIVKKAGGGRSKLINQQSDKQKEILNTQVIKMSMNNIPYTFSGKKDENVNHFIFKLLNYCKNNKISQDIIINLLLNGTLLKADAFNYIELEKDAIGKLDELNAEARLNGILELLKVRYRCENLVMKIKKEIKDLVQSNNEMVKEYLTRATKLFDKLNLELRIAAALGQDYKGIDENEKADFIIHGMRSNITHTVLDKAIDIFGTARVNYSQLKEILSKIEKKELYLKSLGNVTKAHEINNISYPSPTKGQLKGTIQSLRNEINFIKLGNKKLYGRTPNDRNSTPNRTPTFFTLKDKKENGPCPFKSKCRFGLKCKYLHEQSERDYFYKNNVGTGRGRGGFGNRSRGRGGFGNRGGGRGRFYRNNDQLVQINTIEQKNDENDESINISSLEVLPKDF